MGISIPLVTSEVALQADSNAPACQNTAATMFWVSPFVFFEMGVQVHPEPCNSNRGTDQRTCIMTTAGALGFCKILRRKRSKKRAFWLSVYDRSISLPSLAMNSTNTRSEVLSRNFSRHRLVM